MPYRGEAPAAVCHRHAAAPAVSTCTSCLQAVCEPCLVYVGTQPRCPACARRGLRALKLQRGALMAGALAVLTAVIGTAGWVVTRERSFDYGARKAEVRFLDDRVAATPCDRQLVFRLVDDVLRAGDARGTLKRIDAYREKCGEWSRLRWFAYSAHQRLGDYDAAIGDASRLIEQTPHDQDFWWWRGQSRMRKGDLEGAVGDFRQALTILPTARYISFDLATALERLGRPCEARQAVLEYVGHHPEAGETPTVVDWVSRLTIAGGNACTAQAAADPASPELVDGP